MVGLQSVSCSLQSFACTVSGLLAAAAVYEVADSHENRGHAYRALVELINGSSYLTDLVPMNPTPFIHSDLVVQLLTFEL